LAWEAAAAQAARQEGAGPGAFRQRQIAGVGQVEVAVCLVGLEKPVSGEAEGRLWGEEEEQRVWGEGQRVWGGGPPALEAHLGGVRGGEGMQGLVGFWPKETRHTE
jgi:hypothetical protein